MCVQVCGYSGLSPALRELPQEDTSSGEIKRERGKEGMQTPMSISELLSLASNVSAVATAAVADKSASPSSSPAKQK